MKYRVASLPRWFRLLCLHTWTLSWLVFARAMEVYKLGLFAFVFWAKKLIYLVAHFDVVLVNVHLRRHHHFLHFRSVWFCFAVVQVARRLLHHWWKLVAWRFHAGWRVILLSRELVFNVQLWIMYFLLYLRHELTSSFGPNILLHLILIWNLTVTWLVILLILHLLSFLDINLKVIFLGLHLDEVHIPILITLSHPKGFVILLWLSWSHIVFGIWHTSIARYRLLHVRQNVSVFRHWFNFLEVAWLHHRSNWFVVIVACIVLGSSHFPLWLGCTLLMKLFSGFLELIPVVGRQLKMLNSVF